ncbi:MAG: hypothetical protein ACT4OY_00675 [Alphaproteobacteria bacterium]
MVYILIAIALLGALTVSFMEPSSQQTSSQNVFKTLSAVESQVSIIRAAIQECILAYPKGDSTIITSGGGVTDRGARKNYPIDPDSDHYTAATPGKSGDRLVRSIRCPGNNPGGVDIADHELLFGGSGGKFLSPPPDLFEEWQYYNGNDGVFFWTSTSKTDEFLTEALTKLDTKYSECEADVVDATAGDIDLDSDSTLVCEDGSVCFRVWMNSKATAEFNGDADLDETGC